MMYRLPRGWKWLKDQSANVVRLATNGVAEVWLSHEGEVVITTPPGSPSCAPASVVLAVLAPLPSGIGGA